MKFDVIISNPPYQLSDGGGTGSSAMPIYQYFVEQAMKLNPRYLTMIIPARWYSGGKGLDGFRNNMLNNNHIRYLVDFFNAADCFPNVDISGGICYFLWDKNNIGDCMVETHRNQKVSKMQRPLLETNGDSFIRFNNAISILHKVQKFNENSFTNIVSVRNPFAIEATTEIYSDNRQDSDLLPAFAYPKNGFIKKSCVRQNKELINVYKVFIAKAYGERGDFPYNVLGKPFIGEIGSCCTETYLIVGANHNRQIVESIKTYIKTKFFRLFVLFKKNTQNAAKNVYQFVPMQDFSKPWTDEELYKKYNLTQEEINFIESMIKPME